MILEHEIPSKSKLYFGKSAKLKRDIESSSANLLESLGFSEITTPLFSYHQQESFSNTKKLIRLNDADNSEVSLRADSTVDVVRIVTNRLGRSNNNKKWFYIQPVYSYPTKEQYQIGAEVIDGSLEDIAKVSLILLDSLDIEFTFQIANMAIADILVKNYNFELEDIKNIKLDKILSSSNKNSWIENLVKIDSIHDLKDLTIYPDDIREELEKMYNLVGCVDYKNIVISPLFYAPMRYYDSLVFRAFSKNELFLIGGNYTIKGVNGAGFALYTDTVIAKKI
jgi:histidyl-tRNA synthetase